MSLRTLKTRALSLCEATGVLRAAGDTRWRRRRLLILCYHGISIDREHEWRPALYMTQDLLRDRFRRIRDGGHTVLPLDEGLSALYEGSLPPRSVVITFDDGGYDFYERAVPVLEEFDYPATVYQSTYYSRKKAPLWPLMCLYLLWLGGEVRIQTEDLTGDPLELDLTTPARRDATQQRILASARQAGLNDADKQDLLHRLAGILGVDYETILDSRILQLMRPGEVSEVASRGFDVQLHTHRHRSPLDREAYKAEIRENRSLIEAMTGVRPVHFCYPSGVYRSEFLEWLAEEGVRSATTCNPGIATRRGHPLLLPRLVDHSGLTPSEFEAWLSGVGHLLSRRPPPLRSIRVRRARLPSGVANASRTTAT